MIPQTIGIAFRDTRYTADWTPETKSFRLCFNGRVLGHHGTARETRAVYRKTAKFKSIMEVACMWCRRTFDYKDGLGSTGKTSSVCPDCLAQGKGFTI